MALQLKIQKPGEQAPKLRLSLTKGARFVAELFWDSRHDLDVHALLATNDGSGAKVTAFEQVLSTYNCRRTNGQGVLESNPDGSFSTPCGTLKHSGDSRSGVNADVDEIISIDGGRAGVGINEIPIFVTIHATAQPATFSDVANAGIRIKKDTGEFLGEFHLSNEFGRFNAVQMGSLLLGPNGWEFHAAGTGFHGDFNTVLGYFS